VSAFKCAGYNDETICQYLEISPETLVKHYKDELLKEKMDLISRISKSAYQKALDGDQKMIEFVLKCQGRWKYTKDDGEVAKQVAATSLMEALIDKL
jgi:hypothetical protein